MAGSKDKTGDREVVHPIPPLFDRDCRVLILGSFPSVRSRAEGFFYGHPQNRFWRVLAAVLGEAVPATVEEKRAMLLSRHIALWDVIACCRIIGSSDGSITDVRPSDLRPVLAASSVTRIFTNGQKATELYRKYDEALLGMTATPLPSTSPANAAYSFDRLIAAWSAVAEALH